jgi:hypothetical protein
MGFLAALVMASEASAGALCPSPNFPAAAFLATGDRPVSVVVADLDGDSVPDLVTANGNSDDVSVLLGNGDGSFQAAISFAAGDQPESVAVADLDGDSVPDLVTANYYSDDVIVFLPEPDVRLLTLAGVALLALLARWRSWCRVR